MKLAIAQMLVEPGRKAANLARAEHFIAQAQGADVVVLPETLTLGWTHPSARDSADPIPGGESCRGLCESARRHRVFICAGLVERAGEQIFNAAVFINPNGDVLIHHRKIHELDIAQDLY